MSPLVAGSRPAKDKLNKEKSGDSGLYLHRIVYANPTNPDKICLT
jgi:hypothetical protein